MKYVCLFILLLSALVSAQETPTVEQDSLSTNGQMILGLFSILIGFSALFLGYSWKRFIYFLSSFSLFGLIGYVIVWSAYPAGPEFVFILVPLIFAISGAITSSFSQAFGILTLGAVTGVSFSMWMLCLRPRALLLNDWAVPLTVSLITLICALLTSHKEVPDDKYPVIISSSFSGAYAIICGIDLFLKVGVGPIFFAVIRNTYKTLPEESVDWRLGFMLVSTWILFIIGLLVQAINHRGVRIQSMLPPEDPLAYPDLSTGLRRKSTISQDAQV